MLSCVLVFFFLPLHCVSLRIDHSFSVFSGALVTCSLHPSFVYNSSVHPTGILPLYKMMYISVNLSSVLFVCGVPLFFSSSCRKSFFSYRCVFNVMLSPHYDVSCFYHLNFVWSSFVVSRAMPSYHAMSPWAAIFTLHCYSWSCRQNFVLCHNWSSHQSAIP